MLVAVQSIKIMKPYENTAFRSPEEKPPRVLSQHPFDPKGVVSLAACLILGGIACRCSEHQDHEAKCRLSMLHIRSREVPLHIPSATRNSRVRKRHCARDKRSSADGKGMCMIWSRHINCICSPYRQDYHAVFMCMLPPPAGN